MATQSVRIGWRPYVTTLVNLLDSYSGAAAAYSLRKIKSSYTGSAIRVRRSSDNTELNIGFDSDGNLDTYALSAFVGSVNGYVTTWYDQSGNGKNAIQTTAIRQPWIIESGVLLTSNNKAGIKFMSDASGSYFLTCAVNRTNTNEAMSMYAVYRLLTITRQAQFGWGVTELEPGANSKGIALHKFGAFAYSPNNAAYWSTNLALGSVVFTGGLITNNTIYYNGVARASTITNGNNGNMQIGGTLNIGKGSASGAKSVISELIFYPNGSQNSNVSLINNDINSYYSIYPNTTSVWNLLTAAYNADTKSLPSLKTSLFAAYNGESNANDSFGSNNGTAVGGLTYTTGKIGNAFTFNGTNAYVTLPSDTLTPSGDFSISLWFNTNSASTERHILSNIHKQGGASGQWKGWGIFTYLSKVYFRMWNTNVQSEVISTTTITNSTWYNVTVTKSGTTQRIYINGTLEATNNSAVTPNYSSPNYPVIGAQFYHTSAGYDTPTLFNGKIDAVGIWNKELTQSEIIELYNSGNGAQYITDSFYKPTTNNALNTNNNGTAQGGLTYGLGKVGTAFVFNGSNAYVSLPNDSYNNLTGDFSISFWVKFSSLIGSQGIFSDFTYNGTNIWGTAILTIGNSLYFRISDGTSTNYDLSILSGQAMYVDTWYYYTITRKANTGSKIYRNGTLLVSDTNTVNPVYNSGNIRPAIGAWNYGPLFSNLVQYYMSNGSELDEVNIWNREITSTEITELYNSGNGKQYPN